MKFIITLVRQALGHLIVLIDFATRPRKHKRPETQQQQVNTEVSEMTLYQFFACPFCIKTRRTLHRLNLPIQTRSASSGSPFRQELIEGGGKVQVPCLRIEQNGSVQWMYDSSQIIRYLEQRYN